MADEADLADEFQERFIADSLQRHRTEQSSVLKATGKCLFCEEPLEAGHRWCDTHCRDDWQREEDAKRRRLGKAPIEMPAMFEGEDA